MTAQPDNVTPIPSAPDAYIAHGWKLCAIQDGTKGPTTAGWQRMDRALTKAPPTGFGVGLLHAYSGTAALDIDDIDLARAWLAERGIDLAELTSARDAVGIDSGNAGHGKLLFNMPFGIVMPSKKILFSGKVALELRCGTTNGLSTQDVLPPSRHPSGTTYRWVGRGNWQALPTIPIALLDIWSDLIAKDSERTVKVEGGLPANMVEIASAVNHIKPDCDRQTWVEVGMALEATGDPSAFDIWDGWSQGSDLKYPGLREMQAQWRSFKPDGGITAASIFHHAYKAGWRRPVADIAGFFEPISVETPEQVIDILDPTPRPPACDLSLWPDVLRRRALEVATDVGCDPIVPLTSALAAISGVADKRIALVLNEGWRVPPTWWTMTIGEPADKKTPASKSLFEPLRKLEIEDRDRYQAELLVYRGNEARHAADMKVYREWAETPEADLPNAVPPNVFSLPAEPQPLRLVINDATTQKVVTMAAVRPKGFLLYMDEMARWLQKLGDPRNTDDRGLWIQGYETGSYAMDRQGAGSIMCENIGLSFYGNVQPTIFRKHLLPAASDGIIQRFLPVVLDPTHNTLWQVSAPDWASSKGEYEQLIRRTYALPQQDYKLDLDAMELFRAFCAWCLKLRDSERILRRSEVYQTALGKLEGTCGRLILLFHLIDAPYSTTVGHDTVDRAVRLVQTFFVPSLRYAYLEVAQERDNMGRAIVDFLIQNAGIRDTVMLGDLRQALRKTGDVTQKTDWQTDQMIRVNMDECCSMGLAVLVQDHQRYPVWSINPAMKDSYRDYRRRIIDAKQMNIDLIQSKIKESGKATEKMRRVLAVGNSDPE